MTVKYSPFLYGNENTDCDHDMSLSELKESSGYDLKFPQKRILSLVYEYIDVTQFDNYMLTFYVRCF
jgi:hypothetical protein